jgi:hypothetical protein
MSSRCPDCGTFVSLEEADPELQDDGELEDTGDGSWQVTVDVRLVRTCANCSTEMKEYNETVEIVGDHDCTYDEDSLPPDVSKDDDRYELLGVDAEGTSETQRTTTNRKTGKVTPIKNPRYMKTYYGANVTANVQCLWCKQDMSETQGFKAQASAFDELN